MFGGGDPFGNPFRNMHNQMRMMDNMMNSMMNDAFSMLDGFGHGPPMLNNGHGRHRSPHENMMMSPFGGFGGGLLGPPLFGGMISQMQNLQNHTMNDPNSMVISQSTMVSFDGNGPPKVVQQSTRKAGNVKETRKAVQAGDEAHLTVGHTIGDRAHVIEKKRDKSGRTRQSQRFVNLEEGDAEDFNSEFKTQAQNFFSGGGLFKKDNGNRAIEGNRNGNGGSRKPTNKPGSSYGQGQTSTPIVTVPDDDEEEYRIRGGHGRNRSDDDDIVFVGNNRHGGPIIREISDDEADRHEDRKRRKGVFGKFLG